MTHGSLFSGIGGFDLVASWLGWENIFQCEKDEFCQRVLKYHFPNTELYGDITKTDFRKYRGQIDVLSGGFPCQPFSVAGNRKGKDDDRYLWPEMLRVINEVRPTWVVGENVGGIVSMVQPGDETPMEGQASLFETDNKETIREQEYVIETICRNLESIGYSVQPVVIPACAVGAPHRRDRVWFIAQDSECVQWDSLFRKKESNTGKFGQFGARGNEWLCRETRIIANRTDARSESLQRERKDGVSLYRLASDASCLRSDWWEANSNRIQKNEKERTKLLLETFRPCNQRIITNANQFNGNLSRFCASKVPQLQKTRLQFRDTSNSTGNRLQKRSKKRESTIGRKDIGFNRFPTQSPLLSRDDGISDRLDGITLSNWRAESIKGYGNAIVPQVAFEIFKAINKLSYQE